MRQLWCQDGQDDGVSSGQLSPMSPSFLSDSRHNLSLSPPLPHRSSGLFLDFHDFKVFFAYFDIILLKPQTIQVFNLL